MKRWWHDVPQHHDLKLQSDATPGAEEEEDGADPFAAATAALAAQHAEDERTKAFLTVPIEFLKHGRMGEPHFRAVYCDLVRATLHYSSGSFPLDDILEVLPGRCTAVLKATSESASPDSLCLAIVAKGRTLDLQATNTKLRDQYVKALTRLIELYKQKKL
jgi:hypothetical protein